MKKIALIIGAIAIMITGCKKKDDAQPSVTNTAITTPTITSVPSIFTQKVLLEKFTGAWCGYCVDGVTIAEEIVSGSNGRVIVASLHNSDGMQITSFQSSMEKAFAVPGFPSGMVNRIPFLDPYDQTNDAAMSRAYWAENVSAALSKTASCGLAISSRINSTNDSIVISVHAGFNQTSSGTINLTVYLVEDSVTGSGASYDQVNYFSVSHYGSSAVTGNDFYATLPSPITGYKHMEVMRKLVSLSYLGDLIPLDKVVANGDYQYDKTVKITSGWKASNMSVIAFINKKGTSSTTHEVLNVQKSKVGSLKNWD